MNRPNLYKVGRISESGLSSSSYVVAMNLDDARASVYSPVTDQNLSITLITKDLTVSYAVKLLLTRELE